MIGLGALTASILFGWVWQRWNATAAFDMGAVFALIAAMILFFVRPPSVRPD
jgi:hypothetical protein